MYGKQQAVPTINVRAFSKASKGTALVVLDVAHCGDSKTNHEQVKAGIAEHFGNKLVAVAGSFRHIEEGPFTDRIAGLVRANTESVNYDSSMTNFKSLSANMFIDDEQNMWALRKTESGQILVKTTGIEDDADMMGMLAAKCSVSRASAEFASLSAETQFHVEGGDLITYVDSAGEVQMGYVIASTPDDEEHVPVLPYEAAATADEATPVEKTSITGFLDDSSLEAPELNDSEKIEQALSAARGVSPVETLLAYYKKLYGDKKEFFAELSKRIKEHCYM